MNLDLLQKYAKIFIVVPFSFFYFSFIFICGYKIKESNDHIYIWMGLCVYPEMCLVLFYLVFLLLLLLLLLNGSYENFHFGKYYYVLFVHHSNLTFQIIQYIHVFDIEVKILGCPTNELINLKTFFIFLFSSNELNILWKWCIYRLILLFNKCTYCLYFHKLQTFFTWKIPKHLICNYCWLF